MKHNCRKILFALSLILLKLPVLNAHEKSSQTLVNSSHVMAVIDGEPLTTDMIDEWTKIMNRESDQTIEERRLQTLRALVKLKAFSNAAQAVKLDKTDDFRKRMKIMKESVLQQMYLDTKIIFPVSDKEIEGQYEKEVGNLSKELEVHARHILVKTDKEAVDLIKRLDVGENFEQLAKKVSTDGSASLGGDLGYFTKGQMVKPFEEAAFALRVGEYTKKPVKTSFGWHIIKVEDMRKKEPLSLEDAKLYIQNMILRERYNDLQKEVLSTLKVSYPDESVAKAMQKVMSDEESLGEFED
ncbi:MAG: peptidyl-prolyl cis-trans isomerase C [Candidatus Tokpelaia sp. JSC188]|nr:MAG: peptidyl-prolyl cis-trans isomerase C [Candidatus Tokpelaia sp. JSC188]